jgi:hypothetical protein
MKTSFLKAVLLVVVACSAGNFARAEELFSRSTIESALGVLTGNGNAAPNAPVADPNTTPAVPAPSFLAPATGAPAGQKLALPQIADLAGQAGLEPQKDGEFIVVARVAFDKWKFPVAITLSGDGDRVHMSMMLARYDQKQPTADKMLALLASNRTHAPAFFSYSDERKQMELLSSVPNDRPTLEAIKAELERMATIAGKTIALWEPNLPPGTVANGQAPSNTQAPNNGQIANSGPVGPANSQPSGQTAPVVTGKWSAARSQTEAFALLLNQDSTFTLVYVNNGKQSRSTGRFTLDNNQLSLNADNGARIAGNFSMTSENTFELIPGTNPASKLTFNRAR